MCAVSRFSLWGQGPTLKVSNSLKPGFEWNLFTRYRFEELILQCITKGMVYFTAVRPLTCNFINL